MTVSGRGKPPDFFEDHSLDPVTTATGATARSRGVAKKKAGFYLPQDLLERFDRHFHRLKLAGVPVENKSALLEAALAFAMDDIEKGEHSRLLAALQHNASLKG